MNVAEILHKPVLPALITSLADLTPEIIQALVEKSAEWHEQRSKCIGGSDANQIMKGNTYQLWLEKTGRAEPENLTKNLNVMLGVFTEPFNRWWFQQKTLLNVDPPIRIAHPEYEFLAANLDGVCQGFPWEAKHTNQFSKNDDVLEWYYPQLQHQMIVTERDTAILSVIFGNGRFQEFTIPADREYQQILISQEMNFWQCVETDTPPQGFEAVTTSVSMDELIIVDMEGNNAWADKAEIWKANKEAAKLYNEAGDYLRDALPAHASKAVGHGVEVTRSRNNKRYVKEA